MGSEEERKGGVRQIEKELRMGKGRSAARQISRVWGGGSKIRQSERGRMKGEESNF